MGLCSGKKSRAATRIGNFYFQDQWSASLRLPFILLSLVVLPIRPSRCVLNSSTYSPLKNFGTVSIRDYWSFGRRFRNFWLEIFCRSLSPYLKIAYIWHILGPNRGILNVFLGLQIAVPQSVGEDVAVILAEVVLQCPTSFRIAYWLLPTYFFSYINAAVWVHIELICSLHVDSTDLHDFHDVFLMLYLDEVQIHHYYYYALPLQSDQHLYHLSCPACKIIYITQISDLAITSVVFERYQVRRIAYH